MTFAEVLKQLRADAGLTQAALSAASGVSLGIIREYEQGRKEPSLRTAAKLAHALDVSVAVLARGVWNGAAPARKPAGRKARK
jgi:transcriptional regulator with XRE-family HTH domain